MYVLCICVGSCEGVCACVTCLYVSLCVCVRVFRALGADVCLYACDGFPRGSADQLSAVAHFPSGPEGVECLFVCHVVSVWCCAQVDVVIRPNELRIDTFRSYVSS